MEAEEAFLVCGDGFWIQKSAFCVAVCVIDSVVASSPVIPS